MLARHALTVINNLIAEIEQLKLVTDLVDWALERVELVDPETAALAAYFESEAKKT